MAQEILTKQYQQQNIIPDQAWPSSNSNKMGDSTWCSQRDEDEAKQLIAIYGLASSDKARINIPPAVINQRKKKSKIVSKSDSKFLKRQIQSYTRSLPLFGPIDHRLRGSSILILFCHNAPLKACESRARDENRQKIAQGTDQTVVLQYPRMCREL